MDVPRMPRVIRLIPSDDEWLVLERAAHRVHLGLPDYCLGRAIAAAQGEDEADATAWAAQHQKEAP